MATLNGIKITLLIMIAAASLPADLVIDNSGPNTSSTGTWQTSGGTDYYGPDSLWARNGATYTWKLSSDGIPGTYEIFMWWSGWSSRTSAATVRISTADGIQSFVVNQQTNSGQWNSLGKFNLNPALNQAYVTIVAANGSTVSTCADAVKFVYVPDDTPAPTGNEKIYLCKIFSWDYLFPKTMANMLTRIGAKSSSNGTLWTYKNASTGKAFDIKLLTEKADMIAALKEKDSHVIFNGHSNYGLGAVITTEADGGSKKITGLKYIDDAQMLNLGSEVVMVKPDGMIYGQIYPNWKPIYQDGSSAVMPRDTLDGAPPYNYYLTYRIPGDPTYYRIERADGSYIERFPETDLPAWYSSAGAKPDPNTNPQYFIMYPYDDYSTCSFVGGTWPMTKPSDDDEYLGYNYAYHAAGTGKYKIVYNVLVFQPGTYEVKTFWLARDIHASNAKFVINHAKGTTTVQVNQRKTGSYGQTWNSLGTFEFGSGKYTVTLSDDADGRVIADCVQFAPVSNPAITQAEFSADRRTGSGALAVKFTNTSIADYNFSSFWDFGDGFTSTQTNPSHMFSSGVYTVSLKITDAKGNTDTETKTQLIVVSPAISVLQAQFTASSRKDKGNCVVYFKDQSSGTVNSRLWDFGDGTTSTLTNPTHVYYAPGIYSVKLAVAGPDGASTETEENFVHVLAIPIYVENTPAFQPSFMTASRWDVGKLAIRNKTRLTPDDMKYARLFYGTCSSVTYYLDGFAHGIVIASSAGAVTVYTGVNYLENYMKGVSDEENIAKLNAIEAGHELFNFNLKPPSMRD